MGSTKRLLLIALIAFAAAAAGVFAARTFMDAPRKSESEVAASAFSASGDSYAALTGRPKELGVIGVALAYAPLVLLAIRFRAGEL